MAFAIRNLRNREGDEMKILEHKPKTIIEWIGVVLLSPLVLLGAVIVLPFLIFSAGCHCWFVDFHERY